MSKIKIYHNPQCSKSRNACSILNNMNKDVEIIEYMKNGISFDELQSVINKLGVSPKELIRKNEQIFKDQFKNKELADSEWIEAMISFPKLIERPIVITDSNAFIARPPELINEFIK